MASTSRTSRLSSAIQAIRQDPDTPTLEQHERRGLPVLLNNSRADISTVAALDRLDQALGLIERYAPDRMATIREDFTAILVRRYPCRAAYYPDLGVCLIELTFLVHPDITPAQVGASIVHEGVHARLDAAGIREGSRRAAADEERACRQAEIEFGLAVPGGEAVVERARAALGLADEEVAPAIDWNLAQERVKEVDRANRSGS
jgi:hypothetical protein